MNTQTEDNNLNRFEKGFSISNNPAEIKLIINKAVYSGKDIYITVDGDFLDDGSKMSIIKGDILHCKELSLDFCKSLPTLGLIGGIVFVVCGGIEYTGFLNDYDGNLRISGLNPDEPDHVIELEKITDIYKVVYIQREINDLFYGGGYKL